MTTYFNPMRITQTTASGTTLQTQGNSQADHSTSSPYTVPEGTQYVSVWSDAVFSVEATGLADGVPEAFTATYPANYVVEIPNVQAGSVITVTEL